MKELKMRFKNYDSKISFNKQGFNQS
jgi:hypothetical protein